MEKYRQEIDGLRAFAVMPVIIHHAFPDLLPGGFVGVDVFFVISGYLITGILMQQISLERLSLFDFYERRARRILPALIVVVIFSTAASWLLMSNRELQEYLESVSGVALFYSNFVFLNQIDYFGVDAVHKPLLHTWSLAIEEQFYIIFPLILLAAWKVLREKLWVPILMLCVLSLFFSYEFSAAHPSSSFYLLHTRFWELAIGSLIAIGFKNEELTGPNVLGWIGIIVILLSVILVSKDSTFPGLTALAPTLGTALVLIGARAGNGSASFLAFRPFVWLGVISYSAYLWHQPLLVFGRRLFLHEMPYTAAIALIMLSIFFAFLSWRFVEKPFRDKSFLSQKLVLISSTAILITVFSISSFAVSKNIGMDRITLAGHSTKWIEDLTKPNYGLGRDCNTLDSVLSGQCTYGDDPEYILWGDSYTMHLAQALSADEMSFTQVTMSACAPIIGIAPFSSKYGLEWGTRCLSFNDQALKFIVESPITQIVMSSPFGNLTSAELSSNVRGNIVSNEEGRAFDAFISTIETLQEHGKRVVIVSPMPQPPFGAAECMIHSSFLGKSFDKCSFSKDSDRRQETYNVLQKVSEESKVPIIYLKDFVCGTELCAVEIMGTPLYRDSSHMPPSGSLALGQHTDFPNAIKQSLEAPKAQVH
jgi:peptidoglycan/LPS O-acetylase OafA/YrhL